MLGVIINYCSTEQIFLHAQLPQCNKFASEIIVSYADILYNGDIEDTSFVSEYQELFPNVKFVKYKVDLSLPLSERKGVIHRPTAYWHNLARWTAISSLDSSVDWVFVLDADEIPEGDRVMQWYTNTQLQMHSCYKMSCYWYFKYPTFQAKKFEDSILLIHKSFMTEDNIFGDLERDFLIASSKTKLIRMNHGIDKMPLWHHFSFVRTKVDLKKKMSNWGHNNEFKHVNIEQLIENVYKNDQVNDFIHGYEYNTVPNKFNINLIT